MPGTFISDGGPGGSFEFCDADNDLIQFRTADDGFDTPGPEVQVADRPVADVGPPARQTVGVVGKGFQMITPAFAPEAAGNGAPVKGYGLDVLAFFAQLVHLPPRLRTALGHRDIASPPPPQCHGASP